MSQVVARLKFEPRDVWVGVYVDPEALKLYVCPLPMCAVVLEPALHGPLRPMLESYRDADRRRWLRMYRIGVKSHLRMSWILRRFPRLRDVHRSSRSYANYEMRHNHRLTQEQEMAASGLSTAGRAWT